MWGVTKNILKMFFLHKIKINGLYMDRNILKIYYSVIAGEFKSYRFGMSKASNLWWVIISWSRHEIVLGTHFTFIMSFSIEITCTDESSEIIVVIVN